MEKISNEQKKGTVKEDKTAADPFNPIFRGPSYLDHADMILRSGINADCFLAGSIQYFRIKVVKEGDLFLVYAENKNTNGFIPFGFMKLTDKGVLITSAEGEKYIGQRSRMNKVLSGEMRSFLLSTPERINMQKEAKEV